MKYGWETRAGRDPLVDQRFMQNLLKALQLRPLNDYLTIFFQHSQCDMIRRYPFSRTQQQKVGDWNLNEFHAQWHQNQAGYAISSNEIN